VGDVADIVEVHVVILSRVSIFWHVDPLLCNDHEISQNTAAVTEKRLRKQTCLHGSRGTVFSVLSMPRCYKWDSWSNELIVRQSLAGKNVSTEAKDIVGICHQAMTGEDIAN
jgi:hypothetical protein